MTKYQTTCWYQIYIALLLFGFTNLAYAQVYHVAASGNDVNGDGSLASPWATISHAIDQVTDGSTIEVGAGLYQGRVRLDQEFDTGVTIRSVPTYRARLRYDNGAAVICFTCRGIVLEGFDIAHSNSNTGGLVIQIQDLLGTSSGSDGGTDPVVSNVIIRNNIIHDSTNNDLLKINNGAEDILVEGNLFYNQAGSDEHIDINSTVDVTVQDNIFFNTGSQSSTSSFVVIKDSNGADDTVLGARNTTVRRNIFMNWQGSDGQGFLRVGEDSTANFEADGVLVESNLFLGNSNRLMRSAFTVQGSRNVRFHHNTVSGNLPTRSYAARLIALGSNQANEQVTLENNIWSDPTGTMGTEGFLGADVFEASAADNTSTVTLNNNLYFNGNVTIPADGAQAVNIGLDANAIIGDPMLPAPNIITLPVWTGTQFSGGFATIRNVFNHVASSFAVPGTSGAGIDNATDAVNPGRDLLGNLRGDRPDIGAVERREPVPPTARDSGFCFPVLTRVEQRVSMICL